MYHDIPASMFDSAYNLGYLPLRQIQLLKNEELAPAELAEHPRILVSLTTTF
jgi:hypothetical protein